MPPPQLPGLPWLLVLPTGMGSAGGGLDLSLPPALIQPPFPRRLFPTGPPPPLFFVQSQGNLPPCHFRLSSSRLIPLPPTRSSTVSHEVEKCHIGDSAERSQDLPIFISLPYLPVEARKAQSRPLEPPQGPGSTSQSRPSHLALGTDNTRNLPPPFPRPLLLYIEK